MTSDTVAIPNSSPAALRIFSPSTPIPWNEYGEVRGLYAPPRSTFAPAFATLFAVSNTCLSFSMVHGPAITTTSGPPIETLPARMMVFSLRKVLPASLYGSLTRTTSWTPSQSSNSRGSTCFISPTTPSTVWCVPVER